MLDARLRADGVDRSLVQRTTDPTTVALAQLDAGGEATYRFETAGTSAPGLAQARLPPWTLALHVGTLGLVLEPIGSTLEALVANVTESVLVMLDVNARPAATRDPEAWRARIRRIAGRADVVKASADDLRFLGMTRDEVLAAGPSVVLVTDGPRAAEVAIRTGPFRVPVPAVEVVDTVGSGDAFAGGFLAWWIGRGRRRPDLSDQPAVRAAVEAAVAVAAVTCTRPGADPPRRAEVAAFLA
jgi:fructokinase